MPKTQSIPNLTAKAQKVFNEPVWKDFKPGLYWVDNGTGWVIGEYLDWNGEMKWIYANTVNIIRKIENVIPERIKIPNEETREIVHGSLFVHYR